MNDPTTEPAVDNPSAAADERRSIISDPDRAVNGARSTSAPSPDDFHAVVSRVEDAAANLPAVDFDEQQQEHEEASSYWDAAAMAPLSPVSAAAIARLRAYRPPPFALWDRLPVNKRAAVLILLYADQKGDLRVVITMRAMSLRNFSGHAAFPGGKADTLQETPYQIARREAWEEIGLPLDDAKMPSPFRIEELCALPFNLARTELVVRPVVAFLHANEPPDREPSPLVEETMIPRLDAKEVAAVFSAPFRNFLKSKDLDAEEEQGLTERSSSFSTTDTQTQQQLTADNSKLAATRRLPPGHWYDGSWISWKEHPWRVHNFYVPVHDQRVAMPGNRLTNPEGAEADRLESVEKTVGRFKVWGMTARILVDAARIAYGKDPEFEHNENMGDEQLILLAEEDGSFAETKKIKM